MWRTINKRHRNERNRIFTMHAIEGGEGVLSDTRCILTQEMIRSTLLNMGEKIKKVHGWPNAFNLRLLHP